MTPSFKDFSHQTTPYQREKDHWSRPTSSTSFSLHKITISMKNIQVSLSHQQYWPVSISHLFHNQSKPKLNQRKRKWIHHSNLHVNQVRLLKTEHIQSIVHQPCSSRWTCTVFTHVQRIQYNKSKGEISQKKKNPHLVFVQLTFHSSQDATCLSSFPFHYSRGSKEEIWPEMTLPILLHSDWSSKDMHFESKLWCSWTTNTTFLKQSNIVQSSVDLILIYAIHILTKETVKGDAPRAQCKPIVFERSITEATSIR